MMIKKSESVPMSSTSKTEADEAMNRLMCEIRNEPIPQKIVELAQQLQEALDQRSQKTNDEDKTGNDD